MLKVWLPLDGDLRNLGASDIEVTNNGATVDNAGKIGKCYYFNGSAQYLQLSKTLGNIYSGDFSWCVWLKPTDNTRSIIFSEYSASGSSGVAFELLANRVIRVYWNGSPDWNFGISIDKDEWSHVAITKKNNTIKVYVNGQYRTEKTGTLSARPSTACIRLGDDYRGGTNVSYMGYMNDARIYDHCLSAAEVKEIAMGLVLHYKLDGGLFGNPNLLARYVVPGQAAPTSTANGGRTTWLGDYKITIPATENADTYFRLFMTEQLVSGTTYTISCKVSGLLNGSYYRFPLFAQGNTSMGVLTLDHNGLCSLTFTMNWTGTQTAATGANGETVYVNFLDDSGRSLVSGQGPITLYDFKLEKGDAATTWCPADSELTINRTIVSDSSGYGHNGTINGTLTISNDTPRYSFSNYMPKTTTITHPRPIYGGTDQEWTCCMWVKLDTTSQSGQQMNNFNSGNNIIRSANGTPLLYLNSGTNDYYNYGNLAVSAGVWTHVAFVFKNSNATKLIYINGENHTNTSGPNKTSTPSGIQDIVTVGYNLAGYISDYRIYCTPLLDTDIKLLYNIGMRVDNLGGVHSFEFKEAGGRELLAGVPITTSYSNHTNVYTNYTNGEIKLTGSASVSTPYISISPSGKTYYYDLDVSVDANNQVYIGFERYDANKTARSNNATVYVMSPKPSTALTHQHYRGTVNLSTDGVNPCAFITLRILNDWSGAASRSMTVHKISLREVTTIQQPKLYKTGIFTIDELNEHLKPSFYTNGIVEGTEFIEN